MISQRQLRANRRNAKKSTGPRTPEGRAACRLNALKHGLAAAGVILTSAQEQAAFAQLRAAFEEEYRPATPTEQQTLHDLVAARWRLDRAQKLESGFFNDKIDRHDAVLDPLVGKISRYETRFERIFYKTLKELQGMRDFRQVSARGNGSVRQKR